MFASVFILLYAAHLVADYLIQTDHMAEHKAERTLTGWMACLVHASSHVVVSALALQIGRAVLDLDLVPIQTSIALAWIGVSHGVIDRRWPVRWWMEHTGSSDWVRRGGAPLVDQAMHVVCLVVASLILAA